MFKIYETNKSARNKMKNRRSKKRMNANSSDSDSPENRLHSINDILWLDKQYLKDKVFAMLNFKSKTNIT